MSTTTIMVTIITITIMTTVMFTTMTTDIRTILPTRTSSILTTSILTTGILMRTAMMIAYRIRTPATVESFVWNRMFSPRTIAWPSETAVGSRAATSWP